jgi:hypothetical protein
MSFPVADRTNKVLRLFPASPVLALSIIFIWFGALKIFDVSPAPLPSTRIARQTAGVRLRPFSALSVIDQTTYNKAL